MRPMDLKSARIVLSYHYSAANYYGFIGISLLKVLRRHVSYSKI